MKGLELIILLAFIIVGFLLYREFTRKKYVKIEHLATGLSGISVTKDEIIFDKPVKISDKFNLLPVGTIIAFNGATPPTGWQLCDGTAYGNVTTPDLRGRFIVGQGKGTNLTNRAYAEKGGEETVTLTVANLPPHAHTVPFYNDDLNANSGTQGWYAQSLDDDGYTEWYHCDTSGGGGEGKPHENMPPFYVLTFIMRVI